MSSTETAKPEPAKDTAITVVTDEKTSTDEGSNLYYYIFIAIVTVLVVFLLYYAYTRFISKQSDDNFTKGQEQERDDPVTDFNLRESIKELQGMQRNILKTISENAA
jgi:hypothetical protein